MKIRQETDEEEEAKLARRIRVSLGIAATMAASLLVVYVAWFAVWNDLPLSGRDTTPWGLFGDFLGGVLNPGIAGLALYWLTEATRIQRRELSETRRELRESKVLQQEQLESSRTEKFERTFFSLLVVHNDVLGSWTTERNTNPRAMVRDAFGNNQSSLRASRDRVEAHEPDNRSGQYFRLLFELLRFIATECPDSTLGPKLDLRVLKVTRASRSEQSLADVTRALIDRDVLQLLAAFCYSDDPGDQFRSQFRALLERFALFRELPTISNQELDREIRKHYDKRAFQMSLEE